MAYSLDNSESTRGDRAALALAAVVYVVGLGLVSNAWSTDRSAGAPITAAPAATAVAEAAPRSANLDQAGRLARHSIALTLRSKAGYEFKYRLDKDAAMVYTWTATAPVVFELHGEPDGARPGYADTYQKGEAESGRGVFVAPTKGIHGWYWENTGAVPVTVTLQATGFFTAALEITAKGEVEHPLQ